MMRAQDVLIRLQDRHRDSQAPFSSRLRLQTLVWLRWLAILGQLVTVSFVSLVLDFPLPIAYCLMLIALSAWLNVFLTVRFPARHRFQSGWATALLAYDILQLAGLLYLTGGIGNPFTVLMAAPVTVSAATLPARNTVLLGLVAASATLLLLYEHLPLPWYRGFRHDLPVIYEMGILAALISTTTFLALYAWRLAKESREMSTALAATEIVLAREQKLHALDELAAAAAHELGTPLSTIALVAKELEREAAADSPLRDDLALLRSQAQRCREILQKLAKHPSEADPLLGNLSVRELIEEASGPYRALGKTVDIVMNPPKETVAIQSAREPVCQRRPGMLYGLANLIENAVDFAQKRVEIIANWNVDTVRVTISDDGPGFPPELIDTLGEPYVSKRGPGFQKKGLKPYGLGLGFFIAKTLLERAGASVALENKLLPQRGAIVKIEWKRPLFEARFDRSGDELSELFVYRT